LDTGSLVFFLVGLLFLMISIVSAVFPQLMKRTRHYKRTKDKIKKPTDVLKYNGYQIVYPMSSFIVMFFLYTDPLKLAGIGMMMISILIYIAILFRDYFNSVEREGVQNL